MQVNYAQLPVPVVAFCSGLLYTSALITWRSHSEKRWKRSYASLSTVEQLEWAGKAPSTLHALVLSATCIYLFLIEDFFSDSKKSSMSLLLRTSPVSTAGLAFSFGYFIVDIAMLAIHYPCFGNVAMGAHHVAALASVGASTLTGQGHVFTLSLLATELTTPLVNVRWVLDKAGLKQHPLYLVNGVAMMISWFFVRVIFLALYFFPLAWRHAEEARTVLHTSCYILLLSVPPMLLTLNVFWFWKIFKGARSLLLQTHGNVEKKLEVPAVDAAKRYTKDE